MKKTSSFLVRRFSTPDTHSAAEAKDIFLKIFRQIVDNYKTRRKSNPLLGSFPPGNKGFAEYITYLRGGVEPSTQQWIQKIYAGNSPKITSAAKNEKSSLKTLESHVDYFSRGFADPNICDNLLTIDELRLKVFGVNTKVDIMKKPTPDELPGKNRINLVIEWYIHKYEDDRQEAWEDAKKALEEEGVDSHRVDDLMRGILPPTEDEIRCFGSVLCAGLKQTSIYDLAEWGYIVGYNQEQVERLVNGEEANGTEG